MQAVTLVTQNATHDDLTDSDYRDIYTELRQGTSLDKLVCALGSAYSKAQWHKYEGGQTPLTRPMRNELRAAVGLPALPLTLAEALTCADPDAQVWRIGDDTPDRIVAVGRAVTGVVCVNGSVSLIDAHSAHNARVTTVTRAARKPAVRPMATPGQNERRQACGATWRDVIEAGLLALEEQP